MLPRPSPRKRRRPALACAPCRRRKVKCDRNSPCGQCIQRNSDLCTYTEDDRTTTNEKTNRRPQLAVAAEICRRDACVLNQPQSLDNIADQWTSGDTASAAETGLTERASGSHQPHNIFPTSHTTTSAQNSSASGPILGTLSKTRIFGHGHWMSTLPLADRLPTLDPITHIGPLKPQQTSEGSIPGISDVLMKCKQLARDIKSQRPSRCPLPAGIRQTFPDPAVTNQLVQIYFDSFESCFRILHFPSFRAEYEGYMKDTGTAKTSFVVKLLLVMSNAAPLLDNAGLQQGFRAKARGWIDVAQGWLSAPIEKDRLSLDGLQVHCLLLLARQVNCVGADLVWISAGSLMRMGIQMGLHQDPDHIGGMALLQKEIRRRLWYTILEMNVQAALDSGMRPMITADDFDTQPPSNFNDDDLDNGMQGDSPVEVSSTPTRASFQCLLATSVLLRLEATRVINALQEEPPYDRVIRLGKELVSVCRNATVSIDHHKSVAKNLWPTEFPYSCCDHFHRRFLLCLHLPYAAKATQNPMYSYSSKAGLEAALDLVSLLDDEMYRRLLLVGGGMFRDILTRGAMLVFLELITQLENENSAFVKKRNQARREPFLKDARNIVQYAQDRLWYGETNVKSYVFVSMAMGQVDAMLSDSSTKDAIIKSASESLVVCHGILRSTSANVLSGVTADPDVTCGIGGDAVGIPSVDDINFDFMNDGNIDFGLAGSWFVRQWEDKVWS